MVSWAMFWPARRQGVTIPAWSKMVVWGRAKAMLQGTRTCYGLVEALEESGVIEVASRGESTGP